MIGHDRNTGIEIEVSFSTTNQSVCRYDEKIKDFDTAEIIRVKYKFVFNEGRNESIRFLLSVYRLLLQQQQYKNKSSKTRIPTPPPIDKFCTKTRSQYVSVHIIEMYSYIMYNLFKLKAR